MTVVKITIKVCSKQLVTYFVIWTFCNRRNGVGSLRKTRSRKTSIRKHAIEQASKRTDRQANRRTDRQTNKQTNKQTGNKQANKQASKKTNKPTKQTKKQAN